MAEKVDRRIRKTKSQLKSGLAQLMMEKSINEISVKELVEKNLNICITIVILANCTTTKMKLKTA